MLLLEQLHELAVLLGGAGGEGGGAGAAQGVLLLTDRSTGDLQGKERGRGRGTGRKGGGRD